MARIYFVKRARKDNAAVKAGESYYWWRPYRSHKRYSKSRPTRSQVTTSPFLSSLYAIQDDITRLEDPTELEFLIEGLDELRYQCEENLENMPDALRDTSESGELLQVRIDGLETWVAELGDIDTEIDEELSEEETEARRAEIVENIQACECIL